MDRSRPTLRLDIPSARRLRGAAAILVGAGLAVSLVTPVAAQSPVPAGDPLKIVVTTSILGAVVSDLVGDRADVQVLMGNGVDPHDWSPSAQDIEAVYGADLVVENGLGLEESLHDALEEAAANGVRVFAATDAIEVRAIGEGEPVDEHDAIAHACGHFDDEPVAVADGGAIPDDHTRYAVALTDGAAGVSLELAEAGEVSIFLGTDVPLAVADAAGTPLTAEATEAPGDECPAIATITTFDLEAGAYSVDLGPAEGVETVDLVYEVGSHEHEGETAAEGEATAEGEHAHEHGSEDPHFWTDPVAMRAVVDALGPVIAELGVDVADRQADLGSRLDALDAQVREILAVIPEDGRKLVTGHESMGYFADQYGFELVGAVIPGLSSQGEVSARELAELAEQIRAQGVTVIFTEIGTPQSVVEAIAGETGASVVELPSHNLPEDGSYATFVLDIANAVASALAA